MVAGDVGRRTKSTREGRRGDGGGDSKINKPKGHPIKRRRPFVSSANPENQSLKIRVIPPRMSPTSARPVRCSAITRVHAVHSSSFARFPSLTATPSLVHVQPRGDISTIRRHRRAPNPWVTLGPLQPFRTHKFIYIYICIYSTAAVY